VLDKNGKAPVPKRNGCPRQQSRGSVKPSTNTAWPGFVGILLVPHISQLGFVFSYSQGASLIGFGQFQLRGLRHQAQSLNNPLLRDEVYFLGQFSNDTRHGPSNIHNPTLVHVLQPPTAMNADARDSVDGFEAEPLLADEERDSVDIDLPERETPPTPEQQPGFRHKKHRRHGLFSRLQPQKRTPVVVLLAVLMFTLTTSGMLMLIPIFRLMEDAICHVHYGKSRWEPIEERLCKVDGVQKELAYLGGIAAMISSVVGLVATLPWGVVADR
jgi:hypothetical protein